MRRQADHTPGGGASFKDQGGAKWSCHSHPTFPGRHTLGNKNILRTADAYTGDVKRPEIEDLLRHTLVEIARTDPELGWDITEKAAEQPERPIVSLFDSEIGKRFSKYHLAKAYLRWTRDHSASALTDDERAQWTSLITAINKALR